MKTHKLTMTVGLIVWFAFASRAQALTESKDEQGFLNWHDYLIWQLFFMPHSSYGLSASEDFKILEAQLMLDHSVNTSGDSNANTHKSKIDLLSETLREIEIAKIRERAQRFGAQRVEDESGQGEEREDVATLGPDGTSTILMVRNDTGGVSVIKKSSDLAGKDSGAVHILSDHFYAQNSAGGNQTTAGYEGINYRLSYMAIATIDWHKELHLKVSGSFQEHVSSGPQQRAQGNAVFYPFPLPVYALSGDALIRIQKLVLETSKPQKLLEGYTDNLRETGQTIGGPPSQPAQEIGMHCEMNFRQDLFQNIQSSDIPENGYLREGASIMPSTFKIDVSRSAFPVKDFYMNRLTQTSQANRYELGNRSVLLDASSLMRNGSAFDKNQSAGNISIQLGSKQTAGKDGLVKGPVSIPKNVSIGSIELDNRSHPLPLNKPAPTNPEALRMRVEPSHKLGTGSSRWK